MFDANRRSFLTAISAFVLICGPANADPPSSQKAVRVAVYKDAGAGKSVNDLLSVLKKNERLKATVVTAKDISAGKLSEFDVVIHPGGSGGKQGRTLGPDGRKQVREFVQRGGGYVGFCAGAYLATNDYPWSLHILDAKVIDKKHWARGFGRVQLELTETGRQILGEKKDVISIYYHQGPLLAPNDDPKTPDYDKLAVFRTEVTKKGVPNGVMKGTTAVAAGRFGKGRVFCFSPHPEKTPGLESFVLRSVLWAAGKSNPLNPKEKN